MSVHDELVEVEEVPNGAVSVEPNGSGSKDSLREFLHDARQRAQHRKTIDLAIPRYEDRLWATLRALDDYSEIRAIVKRYDRMPEDQAEQLIAMDSLTLASVDCYAKRGTETIHLGVTLGKPLADYLGLEAEGNHDAMLQIFDGATAQLMAFFGEFDMWSKGMGRRSDEELAGE